MTQARQKADPTYNGLPFPSEVPAPVMDLLHKWLEWRMIKGAPRAVKLPDPELRYKITGKDGVVASRRFIMAHSTAPRNPGRLEEFNLAFWELDPAERFVVLLYLDLEKEAWKESKAWRDSLRWLALTQRQFERLLEDALVSLTHKAHRRGLL